MNLTFTQREEEFRDELRAWLQEHHPGEDPLRAEESFALRRSWQRTLHQHGWCGISWPEEYGGRGATLVEAAIFNEELARAQIPQPVNVVGLNLGGPTLMVHGSEEQRNRFLEPVLSADEIWCQGFSEPDAGTDLASLKTRAWAVPGGFEVSGQKVWTSFAHHAKWCMLIARTDPDSQRHHGLTFFLMDMQQEAVEVRPLRQITGEAEFNELFIDGAFIPDENVIGGLGDGWRVAMTALSSERAGMAFGMQVELQLRLDRLASDVEARGLADDPAVRETLGRLRARTEILRLLGYRALTTSGDGAAPGPASSLMKWLWSDTNQSLANVAAEYLGFDALDEGSAWSYEILRARANSIEGGTTEILKSIVSERILGLPRVR